jgi:holo-[acyl-carrier protein] synthase
MVASVHLGVSVGVDLVRVDDVAASIQRFGDRYTRRIFTPDEIDYCTEKPDLSGRRFAARFAAKEATLKVLRIGPGDALDWRSIEVRRAPDGWVTILLDDAAGVFATRAGVSGLSLSLSHDGDYAIATVVATCLQGASQ